LGRATGSGNLHHPKGDDSLCLECESRPLAAAVHQEPEHLCLPCHGLIAPSMLCAASSSKLNARSASFSLRLAFPFTLHSICLASTRGLPYHFGGVAGRYCSCLYRLPRSRGYRYLRRGAGIQAGLTSYEGAFIIGCHFLGCHYLGVVVVLTGSKGEKLHCDQALRFQRKPCCFPRGDEP
jgi:hypothetical protein